MRLQPRSVFFLAALFSLSICTAGNAATTKVTVTGSIDGGVGYSVLLMFKDGSTRSASLSSSGKFSFSRLSVKSLKGASLQLISPEGRYAGPVVLKKKGNKAVTTFSGKAPSKGNKIVLGKLTVTSGYATTQKKLSSSVYGKALVGTNAEGKPLGAGELGLVAVPSAAIRGPRVQADAESSDSDLDGIPDPFDADDDGDLVLDAADADATGTDVPYTGMVHDFRRTLNAQVRSGLTDSNIDSAISSEHNFTLTFFYSLPDESTVDGGHVICAEDLVYCRPNSPTAQYSGVNESAAENRDRPWSDLLTPEGYPQMERISVGGRPALVASIEPRVGRSQFQPGDAYQVALTSGSSVTSLRTLALAPYFVSVPALQSYNAGSGTVTVDYSSVSPTSGSIPGTTESDPIVLSSSGNLALTFWRLQRAALRSDESGYYDFGHLHYGVVIEQLQATCAGYYSAVHSDLTEDSDALGEGSSPLSQNGANLYPLTDSQGDRAVNVDNTLSLSVNLRDCLSRAGGSAGTYRVVLTAAGEEVTGGQARGSQSFYVQIP